GEARRDAFHAPGGIAVAVAAGLLRGACLFLPQRLAVEHPESAGVGAVVVLHGARFRAHEVVAGAPRRSLDLRECAFPGEEKNQRDEEQDPQTTVSLNDSVTE